MSLKAYKLDQSATEIFISELNNKESFCNVMPEIYKKPQCEKYKFQKIAWIIWDEWLLIQIFLSWYLLVSLFSSRHSISLILKENDSIFVF